MRRDSTKGPQIHVAIDTVLLAIKVPGKQRW
jgi:hypothetical protein